MRQISEEQRLPTDVEAQPLVQAAAALRPVIRGHHDEIEREQRLAEGPGRAVSCRRLLSDGEAA